MSAQPIGALEAPPLAPWPSTLEVPCEACGQPGRRLQRVPLAPPDPAPSFALCEACLADLQIERTARAADNRWPGVGAPWELLPGDPPSAWAQAGRLVGVG